MTESSGDLLIYTTVSCGQCWFLKLWLKRHGVPYTEIGIENDDEARRFVRRVAAGYMSVPVVVLPDGHVFVEPTHAELQSALAR